MKSAKRKVHRHLAAGSAAKVTERLIPRKAVLDMERGLTTSRNAHESKFGKALLTALTHDDFALTTTLNVLRAQSARTQAHCNQERRAFIHRLQVLPDPTILLERPPSPVRTGHARSEPGYMRATAAKPSPQRVVNFATIDAFAVEKSRLTPAWEVGAPPSVRNTRFRCLSKPSTPLSRFEKHDLVRGLTYHARNVPLQQQATGGFPPPRHATNAKRREAVKARVQAIVLAEEAGERQEDEPRVFVTDFSDTKVKSSHKTRHMSRQVSFVRMPRMPTHDSESFSLFDTTSREITTVCEEVENDKLDVSATTVSKGDSVIRAKANAGTAKAGTHAASRPQPTSAQRKHKKAKNQEEKTKYRRSGLNLVPS